MSVFNSDRRHMLAAIGLSAASRTFRESEKSKQDLQAPGAKQYMIEDFGAVGDGRSDDTQSFEKALSNVPAGSVIQLRGGRSYRLTRSLVVTRPVAITGGAKEDIKLIFHKGHYAKLGGVPAAFILPHERDNEHRGSARRTTFSGFSILWAGGTQSELCGVLIAAPAYFNCVDVKGFTHNGFHIEAESDRIRGNANGSSFINCSAIANARHGFFFAGNDANACMLLGSRAFDNNQNGFHDASFLGNTYIASEADGNRGAGYFSIKELPNRSVFVGCYAEPNQRYDLNRRNLVLGGIGHVNGVGGPFVRALPSGDLFSSSHLVFASEESIAAVEPGASGSLLRLGHDGLDIHSRDGQRLRVAKLLSHNYIDILNGKNPVIRFPARPISGNVTDARPWLPSGLAIGKNGKAAIVGAGTAPPSAKRFEIGSLWLNEAPKPGGFVGWVYVASGQSEQWLPFGQIENAV